MALIVEDGTLVDDAEAYITVADADAYFTLYGNPSDWADATDPVKETALRMGAQYLDVVYQSRWRGLRIRSDQALDWPRAYVEEEVLAIIAETMDRTIPPELKRANAEAALRYIQDGDLLPDIDDPGATKQESVKVGPISETTIYVGGKQQVKRYRKIDLIIAPILLNSGGGVERG